MHSRVGPCMHSRVDYACTVGWTMHAQSGGLCMHSQVDYACTVQVDHACMIGVDDALCTGGGKRCKKLKGVALL